MFTSDTICSKHREDVLFIQLSSGSYGTNFLHESGMKSEVLGRISLGYMCELMVEDNRKERKRQYWGIKPF